MTAEQKQQIMQLRGSFLQEQAHHQAQWRLLCQCMHQVCCCLHSHDFNLQVLLGTYCPNPVLNANLRYLHELSKPSMTRTLSTLYLAPVFSKLQVRLVK